MNKNIFYKVVSIANKSIDLCDLGNIFEIYILEKGSEGKALMWRCDYNINEMTEYEQEFVIGRFATKCIINNSEDFFRKVRDCYNDTKYKDGTVFIIYAHSDTDLSWYKAIETEQDVKWLEEDM